ncbi:MAG TPA: UDP-N-acetylmuramate--L-alanine ligase [Conexibacter sp.]|nr:UDP-N-acetylmuramate--L-alanine ligase [Conexibacter sp.]
MTDERAWAGRRLHFIGIGGAGMSGLALVARALGAAVSGSDRAESATLARLRAAGIDARAGHDAANVPDGAEVVHSTAVPAENPERAAARARGLRELHRADLLGEITALRRCIAITGTHGKTTTTSMVVHALRGCGLDPGYLVGGELRSTGSNAGWGAGEWVVVEADESDRSLLKLHPDVAVLTNSELDHHATYAGQRELDDTFRAFLARATVGVVVWDRPELRALVPVSGPEVVAYDVPSPVLDASGSRFDWRGIAVRLPVLGAHNALNAAAAIEACRLAGADPQQAAAALADFPGAGRRFELLGTTAAGVPVYDDYAHHPTEVAATIAAARTLAGGRGRIVAVFQPHLYSRTRELADAFGAALAAADLAIVLDVYPARERAQDFPGVSAALIAEAGADAGGAVVWEPDFDAAHARLQAALHDDDVCLVMGAGDVDVLGRRLVS